MTLFNRNKAQYTLKDGLQKPCKVIDVFHKDRGKHFHLDEFLALNFIPLQKIET